MPLRLVDDNLLNNPFVVSLDVAGKLFAYVVLANPQQRISGIWSATPTILSEQTAIPVKRIEELLEAFDAQGLIRWYPQYNTIWTKETAREQIHSPKALPNVLSQLMQVPTEVAKDFMGYYPEDDIWSKWEVKVDMSKLQQRLNSHKSPNAQKTIQLTKAEE